MEPGDMVFYESATCVHGRPTPLKGKYFANAFIHYKPEDPTIWPVNADVM
jgi:prolyl 4-hydroxylase